MKAETERDFVDEIERLILKLGKYARRKRDVKLQEMAQALWEYTINLEYQIMNRNLKDTLVN